MEYVIYHSASARHSFLTFQNCFKRKSNLNKYKRKESYMLIEVLSPERSYGHRGVNQNPVTELMLP